MRNAILFSTLVVCSLCADEQDPIQLVIEQQDIVAWGTSAKKAVSSKDSEVANKNGKSSGDPCDTTYQDPPETCAYNAPVVLNPNACANLYVSGSYLYWRASADYIAYAYLNNSFSPNPNDIDNIIFKGKVLKPDFKYSSGFKTGLGYKFHRDCWDLFAEYTRFHQSTHTFKEVTPGGQNMVAVWTGFVIPALTNDTYRSCSSDWTTNFDILDAEIGRDFFCGRYLALRPSLGLRALWLEQKYNLTYTTLIEEIVIHSHNKSMSWGIGPRVALSNTWNLFGGLKILGDVGISILHVQDHVSVRQFSPFFLLAKAPSETGYRNREHISMLKPILDLSIGMGWGRPFSGDKCAFDLQLSYDYSIYYDQGSIQIGHAPLVPPGGSFLLLVGDSSTSVGNLSVQGLKATARLDF